MIWLVLALLGGGAAWAAPSRDIVAAASAAALRVAQLEQLVVEQEARVRLLEDMLQVQRESQADKLESLDAIAREVQALKGQMEVMSFQVAEARKMVDQFTVDMDGRQAYDEVRLRQLETFLKISPPPRPDSAGAPAEVALPEGPMPATAAAKLAAAREHLAAGRHAVARALLNQAVQQHVGARELPDIRMAIGDSFAGEGNWRSAASAYQVVVDSHGSTDQACWASLRTGECFDKLGNPAGAKLFYEAAVEGRCARSGAAKEARQRL